MDVALRHSLPTRWFDDFFLGEKFTLPSRVLTVDIFAAFATASGEAHPLHADQDLAPAHGLPGMLAHGLLLTIQTVAGAGLFPFRVEESLIGMVDQASRMVRPVHCDDRVHPVLQVTELAPNASTGIVSLRSTVHNQRRELVLEGTQRWLLRKNPAI